MALKSFGDRVDEERDGKKPEGDAKKSFSDRVDEELGSKKKLEGGTDETTEGINKKAPGDENRVNAPGSEGPGSKLPGVDELQMEPLLPEPKPKTLEELKQDPAEALEPSMEVVDPLMVKEMGADDEKRKGEILDKKGPNQGEDQRGAYDKSLKDKPAKEEDSEIPKEEAAKHEDGEVEKNEKKVKKDGK